MNKKHWTPRYIISRLLNIIYEFRHPEHPWLTSHSIKLLDELLKPSDVGLEFGSGRSTLWLVKRLKYLTSVEDNEVWYQNISNDIKIKNINNIDYLYKSSKYDNPYVSEYFKVLQNIRSNSLDFILVDGSLRDIIAIECVEKLKLGGILVIDNANWFLSHYSLSPSSLGMKNSMNDNWEKFLNSTKDWRLIWTTNGVTDTALFIKK